MVEGKLAIDRLLRSPYETVSLFISDRRLPVTRQMWPNIHCPVLVATDEMMNAVAGYDLHRGLLALGRRPPPAAPETIVKEARQVAVLEGLNDLENLGVLFRNAAALGVDAVLLSPTTADPLYRRSIRVSLGHVLGVPFARVAPWPDGLGILAAEGLTPVALTPDESAMRICDINIARPAWLLGAEGPGLTTAAQEAAEHRVRIPMEPKIDSLNVAAAAAIAFHHGRCTQARAGTLRP